jgi:hypothetical protein
MLSVPGAHTVFSIKPTNSLMAVVGQNQTVSENTTVRLSGGGVDPDQSAKLSYLWKQIDGGPSVKLSNSSSSNPSFIAPIVPSITNLKFSLVVKDDKGLISNNPAIVTITVKHIPPVANAGSNQTVNLSLRPSY